MATLISSTKVCHLYILKMRIIHVFILIVANLSNTIILLIFPYLTKTIPTFSITKEFIFTAPKLGG